MTVPISPLDLGGPLPQVDDSNRNQQRSLARLTATLTEELRFRDERADDFGVDGTIEVHSEGSATNFRSEVQLKSKERDSRNNDGSLSYSAKVANLVYLLNGRSPLYVVYVLDTDSLLYAWVRDEVERIEAVNAAWKQQDTVTVHLTSVLDATACGEIRDRILREGVLRRNVSEFVAKAAGGSVQLTIDAATFAIAKRDDAARLIAEQGIAFSTAGSPQEVMAKADVLTQAERELPDVALALGYAEYTRGRYAAAEGHLSLARIRESELEPKRLCLLTLLSNACDLEFGRISREQYLDNEKIIVRGNGPLERQHQARVLWEKYLEDRHPDRVQELVAGLSKLVEQSTADLNDSAENRFQLVIALLTSQTDALISDLVTINAKDQIAQRVNLAWVPQGATQPEWQQRWVGLIERQKQLLIAAEDLGNAMLVGQVKALLAFAQFQRLLIERLMAAPLNVPPPDQNDQIYALMPAIEEARKLASSVGDIAEEIRLTLRLADMLMAAGNTNVARQVAFGTLGRARALRLNRLIVQAETLSRGDWFIHTYEKQLFDLRAADEDELTAAETDDEITRLARSSLHVLDLPPDRFEAVREELEANRLVARERLEFCRHLRVIQDLGHTNEQATMYAEMPDQACRCDFMNRESPRPSKDTRKLLDEFKKQNCHDCSGRVAKRSTDS